MNKYCKLLLPALAAGGTLLADVKLPAVFSDHAVLQKSAKTAVFGTADPGEKVSVTYGNAFASAVAGKDGKWLVDLDLSKDDGKSKILSVSGKNKLTIKDVITGEVWLAAGQSNMAFQMQKSLNAKEEIKNSENPRIRTFKAERHGSLDPAVTKHKGSWIVASTRRTSMFSAVGYHFAKKVTAETGLTVGLIDPAWGSSSIESWMSSETLMKKSTPEVAASAKRDIERYTSYDAKLAEYVAAYNKWAADCGRIDDGKSTAPPADAKWSKRKNIFGGISGNGVLWFRKKITVKKSDYNPQKKIIFTIGCPGAPVDFYLDGKKIASFPLEAAVEGKFFRVPVSASEVAPGEHEMTLRVNAACVRFSFGRYFYAGRNQNNHINWEMCREKNYPKLTKAQIKSMPASIGKKTLVQKTPTMIWNAMMIPMVPYTMRGVIWYQGESNSRVEYSKLYSEHQRAFVEQLRNEFRNPDLYYYTVQLAPYKKKSSDPADAGTWPELRRQQEITSLTVKNAYHVQIIDVGEAGDIHPIDKTTVGQRLANVALANVYGKKDVQWKNPRPVKAVRQGASVRLTFVDIYAGLEARKLDDFHWVNRTKNIKAKLVPNSPGSEVEGFAICGKDGKWVWANAKIEGADVIVSSPAVKEPVAVRYAWQDNPTCNLFSKSGIPVSSFNVSVK